MKKILVPVDGSKASLNASKYALRIARLLNAEIKCIHIIDSPPLLKRMNPALVALYFSRAEEHAQRWMSEVKQIAKKANRSITSEIIINTQSVAWTIIEHAEKQHVDWMIMGTRGKTGVKKLLLRSVANAVTTHAPCPVLLVP